ncbi:hypothetical protein C8046_03040 [Serinibacter arcticus]|uniref:Uncharacterized protein n=2 Tax=Serinibacter arcticus TaxID=1655435 RepID=A0A2U1ZS94_9MICO|nr:hypothetical protein C8046_03040 [Serinibacter arcticus]
MALLGATMVPLLIVLGLIFPWSGTTQIMLAGWAAIGSSVGLWMLLRNQGRTSAPYIALVATAFALVAVIVFFAYPVAVPTPS